MPESGNTLGVFASAVIEPATSSAALANRRKWLKPMSDDDEKSEGDENGGRDCRGKKLRQVEEEKKHVYEV